VNIAGMVIMAMPYFMVYLSKMAVMLCMVTKANIVTVDQYGIGGRYGTNGLYGRYGCLL